jgi:hypothetical protein
VAGSSVAPTVAAAEYECILNNKTMLDEFPDALEFFVHFLDACESHYLNKHIKVALIAAISSLSLCAVSDMNGRAIDQLDTVQRDLGGRIKRLKVLAKFLGFVMFSPNWVTSRGPYASGSHAFETAIQDAVRMSNEGDPEVDLLDWLRSAWRSQMLVLVVPWVVELLRMMRDDRVSPKRTYMKETLDCLRQIWAQPWAAPSMEATITVEGGAAAASGRGGGRGAWKHVNSNLLYVMVEVEALFEHLQMPLHRQKSPQTAGSVRSNSSSSSSGGASSTNTVAAADVASADITVTKPRVEWWRVIGSTCREQRWQHAFSDVPTIGVDSMLHGSMHSLFKHTAHGYDQDRRNAIAMRQMTMQSRTHQNLHSSCSGNVCLEYVLRTPF